MNNFSRILSKIMPLLQNQYYKLKFDSYYFLIQFNSNLSVKMNRKSIVQMQATIPRPGSHNQSK